MSEQEFESYLRLLGRFLRLSDKQREVISQELRDHMEERLEELIAQGYTREEAIETALDEFGDAAALATDFGRAGRRRRWIMRSAAGTIGIAATVLIVSFLLPQNRPLVPSPGYSQADQVGTVPDSVAPVGSATTQPAIAAAGITLTPESENERRTRAKLAQIIPKVFFHDGTTMEEVIDFLREAGKVSIDVNWNALDSAGVDKTAPTNRIQLNDITLGTVLTTLLKNVGTGLAYNVADGFIRISTRDEIERDTVTRVYDCKDLIGHGLAVGQLQVLRHRLNDLAGRPLPGTTMDLLVAELQDHTQDKLVDLVKSHIFPDTWEPEETVGSVSIYDGILVVTHNRPAHQKVAELIAMLRAARVARISDVSKDSISLGGIEESPGIPIASKDPALRRAFNSATEEK